MDKFRAEDSMGKVLISVSSNIHKMDMQAYTFNNQDLEAGVQLP